MLNKLKSILPDKWRLASILALSFAVSFMVSIYSPLDIYLHNPTVFVVGWRFLLPPLLIVFTVSFITISFSLLLLTKNRILYGLVLFLLLTVLVITIRFTFDMLSTAYIYILSIIAGAALLWTVLTKLLKDTAADITLLLLWGGVISAYIQVLFLNGEMGSISGAEPDYKTLALPNLMIWVVITLLLLCLWIILKVKKKDFRYEKLLIPSVLIISGMQIAGLVSTAVSNDLPKGFEEEPEYISYEPALSLNHEENILVFILDMLSVERMREGLEEYPHIRESLDGFTLYENNISEYFRTLPSVPTMMTQHRYKEGQTMSEYWTEAWAQRSYVDTLREHGFTTNLYLDYMTTYGSLDEIAGKTDNIREFEAIRLNTRSFISSVMRLSLGRLSPYILKNAFLAPVASDFGNSIFTLTVSDPLAVMPPVVSNNSDLQFFEYINQNEMSSGNSKKVFTVMHMIGAHYDYGGVPNLDINFTILNTYFDKMKETGVYDNTTILIIGDHGDGNDFDIVFFPTSTSVLIKPRGSAGELAIDTESELSHKYFPASLLEIAGIPQDSLGLSYFDIINGASSPVRIIYALSNWFLAFKDQGDAGTMIEVGKFEVSGDSNNDENWRFIPSP